MTPRIPAGVALSIRQPWAWLIVNGYKDVENRTWNTHYRGPLLIHASRRLDRDGLAIARARRVTIPVDELEYGALIGRANLVDVVTDSRSRWANPGLHHFLLEDATAYARPIPCAGRLGLFDPRRSA